MKLLEGWPLASLPMQLSLQEHQGPPGSMAVNALGSCFDAVHFESIVDVRKEAAYSHVVGPAEVDIVGKRPLEH